nr:DUF4837 family protein [Marivirga aurantiaca]
MQNARGEDGEIILVMAPDQWNGALGQQVKDLFRANVEAIPQDEPLYDIKRTDPSKFNSVLKASKNLMFVATLDNNSAEGKRLKKYFTDNSIEQIKNNPDIFSFNQEDVYAKGQEVLYLFGRTEEELMKNIEENKEKIQQFFNKVEEERMVEKIKKSTSKGVMNYLSSNLGLDMVIPYGFDLAVKDENHAWIRKLDQREELNIWVVKMPFNDESVFDPANLKSLRNELGRKYITDKDNDSLYITTQDQMNLVIDTVNLNGNFALQTKGLWKYSDNSRGGAFVSYLFANEQSGDLYYVEGYLDNPGKDKREPMRKLEAILSTADIPDTIND